jgi:putative endonuclease
MNRRQTGKRGETIAASALEKAGYTLLDRNWRCPEGELDIVARRGIEIVFVEVRARAGGVDVALESITPAKQERLLRLADAYLSEHGLTESPFRIDIVAVGSAPDAVEIIENAVGW